MYWCDKLQFGVSVSWSTELEHTVGKHDETIRSLVAAIRQLMAPTEVQKKRAIGFGRDEDKQVDEAD